MNEESVPSGHVLAPGFQVALVLRLGAAPSRCHTGRVREVDEHGVRLTLTHWAVGQASGWDFFAPWSSITAALVATPEHDRESFDQAAATFFERCKELGQPTSVGSAAANGGTSAIDWSDVGHRPADESRGKTRVGSE